MRTFNQIAIGLFLATTGCILAGALLESYSEAISLVPGLFILLPGFLEMKGNISGTLSARMSAALHLGKMRPHVRGNRVLAENLIAAVTLVLLTATLLGVLAYGFGVLAFGIANLDIIPIAIAAAMIASVVQLPATVVFCFWLFRKGYDPDNIMGPYITTIGDIISVVSILAAILVVT